MTSCAVGNLCWWGDPPGTICPYASVGKLGLWILGITLLVVIIGHFLSKYRKGGILGVPKDLQ